ncbi:MAG: hypothetical protein IIZ58_04705 [Desulfovibrio sp.]|nr:hypothetical protein [Desulfovibrio sp.]
MPILAALACLLWPAPACAEARESQVQAEWTVMVYMCADNNLEYPAIMDLLEMEQALPPNVQIAVLMDRHKGYSPHFGNWTGAKLLLVKRAAPFDVRQAARGLPGAPLPASLASEALEDWGEVDMSDPATLSRFVKTCAQRFPAKRYALIPWNHGGGWPALVQDEDAGSGVPGRGTMSVQDFVKAAREGAKALPRGRFDLLKYDMCLMGQLDVLAESATLADYAVACAPLEPATSSDYLAVTPLFAREVSTRDLARLMVERNVAYYRTMPMQASFSAYDLAQMPETVARLKDLAGRLEALAPSRYQEITRAASFARRQGMLLTEDVKLGKKAYSAVELFNWLGMLERELPDAPKQQIQALRQSLSRLMFASGATPSEKVSQGLTLYLPLRRELEHDGYRQTAFADHSGMGAFLAALYKAQELQGSDVPRIENLAVGFIAFMPGRRGYGADADLEVLPSDHLTPFSRSGFGFDITGSGILMSYLWQFEKRGEDRVINCVHLLCDLNREADGQEGSALDEVTPRYVDGRNTFRREITVKYKVSGGAASAPVSVVNTTVSRNVQENFSVVWGLYRDDFTTGGQEVPVRVKFSNVTRMPMEVVAYQEDGQGGMTNPRLLLLQPGSTFRPALLVRDRNFAERKEYGPPLQLPSGAMFITVDMPDEGAEVGWIVETETVGGKRVFAASPTLPVRRDPALDATAQAASAWGQMALPGRYAMVQLQRQIDGFNEELPMPTFNTLELQTAMPFPRFTFRNRDRETGRGLALWVSYGTPQLALFKEAAGSPMPLGEPVQTFFAFLDGQGEDRVWRTVEMGEGTRWIFVPLEQYRNIPLEGVWTSDKGERWEFRNGRVRFTWHGQTGEGPFTLRDSVLFAQGIMAPEYAVYYDRSLDRLYLAMQDGRDARVRVSALVREGRKVPPAPALAGRWTALGPNGPVQLDAAPVAGTPYLNFTLSTGGRIDASCTVGVGRDQLSATYSDGWQEHIAYALTERGLLLRSQRLPALAFTRQPDIPLNPPPSQP